MRQQLLNARQCVILPVVAAVLGISLFTTGVVSALLTFVSMHLQDDLLYESLTVWETLYFAAMLRLPRNMSTDDKKQRVAKVIAALGLNRCKDTIIGKYCM